MRSLCFCSELTCASVFLAIKWGPIPLRVLLQLSPPILLLSLGRDLYLWGLWVSREGGRSWGNGG
jgi:hypothetical protein